ncbi:glutamate--tRNA ligase [Reichenbachiella versicolor]|uniref:glutamate--tRNA ligase n=1 Tax=Reichenbachiella versicolor TaxID=1821036 RepID=UPI000D6E3C68|nr:glutamate--tRNA ligase [Reichenbachiella versicolor]
MKEVRVRFAPSPTGVLHIGGVRTALYNYLYARQNAGKFILRIEDTDQTRFVEGAEEYIMDSLKWCGVTWDEGVDVGGEYGPYRQSDRKDIYKQYAMQMVEEGTAYYAFDTAEELDAMRERLKEAKANSLNYNSISRNTMKNSLTLSEEEVKQRIDSGESYVIRFKMPAKEDVRFKDMVRDWINVHTSTLDDKVLMKSDGMPTYHLANVVDDHLMKITHVIRGEEWLPSAPLHIMLYRALGWEDSMPEFAHLPLLLKPDGNGKLSKRDAAKHGFPIFPLKWQGQGEDAEFKGFKEEGFMSASFVNFLAFLGWNPGTENELFTLQDLVKEFSVERINKSGAKFDYQKAIWFNQQYLKEAPSEELVSALIKEATAQGVECDEAKAEIICELMKERIEVLPQLLNNAKYFFEAPAQYVEKVVRKKWKEPAKSTFSDLVSELATMESIKAEGFQTLFNEVLERNETHAGAVMQVFRVAVTGEAGGPDLMKIVEVLGTKEVKQRIENAVVAFNQIAND